MKLNLVNLHKLTPQFQPSTNFQSSTSSFILEEEEERSRHFITPVDADNYPYQLVIVPLGKFIGPVFS